MLKHVCLILLVVALVTCKENGRGGRAKNKAKNKAKEMGREAAREQVEGRVENMDREAAREKAEGKKNKYKEMFGDGKSLSKKKLLKMTTDHLPTGIHLPTGMKGVPEACIDAEFGESPAMEKIRRGGKDKFYVCAFVNFQHGVGEDKVSPPYTEETVDMRFALFKQCVDEVNKQNKRFRAGEDTHQAGINFFCDLTDEERRPYSNGLVMPDE